MQGSAVCNMVTASSFQFTVPDATVCSDTLHVTSARISTAVIRLFVRASRRMLRSSRGTVLLEGPVTVLS